MKPISTWCNIVGCLRFLYWRQEFVLYKKTKLNPYATFCDPLFNGRNGFPFNVGNKESVCLSVYRLFDSSGSAMLLGEFDGAESRKATQKEK